MADTNTKIEVSMVGGAVRVSVVLPDMLTALSPRDQDRVMERAMWKACEAARRYLDRVRVTGSREPLTALVA